LKCDGVLDLSEWHTARIKFSMDLSINEDEGGLSHAI